MTTFTLAACLSGALAIGAIALQEESAGLELKLDANGKRVEL